MGLELLFLMRVMLVKMDKSRAPEELRYRYGGSQEEIHRDKADVWIMGTVLYYVLTKQWDFEGLTVDKAKKLLMKGQHSDIPAVFTNSTNAADRAMVRALEMAWVDNPDDRPSARQIADYLRSELEKHSKETVYRVSVPELPTDFDYEEGENDWYQNYRYGRND